MSQRDILVTVHRKERVDGDALLRFGSELLEWLEGSGVKLIPPANATWHDDLSYEDWVIMFMNDLHESRSGQIQ